MSESHTDLLAPLTPPEVAAGLLPGTIAGPPGWWEGFGAGLRVWCGPLHGWRDLGELLGQPSAIEGPPVMGLMLHKGRLQGGLSWNLGAAKLPRRPAEEHDDE